MEQSVCEMSEGETSDDTLKIVIESPKRKSLKKPRPQPSYDEADKEIIDIIEQELVQNLEEKANKTNLSTNNVKNILRHVVTNEHVLAMVRHAENPDTTTEMPYVPKLTRAKVKELRVITPLPWLTPTKASPGTVQQLISDELDEDSSGDEYVPAEDESEDDLDNSVTSEQEPPSPLSAPSVAPAASSTINWSEDGIFKVPPTENSSKAENPTKTNIALRTRSKLCLSSTPLEVIEGAFIPPDITTDMYDMDCDDDDWRDFLKKFTRPLDEITRANEDEDHDPEYNILADEEIDEVDTEELRTDKAVNVSKKELNELIAELFECANVPAQEEAGRVSFEVMDATGNDSGAEGLNDSGQTLTADDLCEIVTREQKMLIEQQLRQHVQMLTQDFLLTYQHPEFHESAQKLKESLLNIKLLSENKDDSTFNVCNLENAIKLVAKWEMQLDLNTDEVKSMKRHVTKVITESKESRIAGTEYILTFPPLIMETITKSDVFLYPNLLPRVPFKSASTIAKAVEFLQSEDELLALGIEQFVHQLAQDPYHLTHHGTVNMKHVCHMIALYLMPAKDVRKLYDRIFNSKHHSQPTNPIKHYFKHKKAPPTVHYVMDLAEFGVLPPCRRDEQQLPPHWRAYVFGGTSAIADEAGSVQPPNHPITKVTKPPRYNKSFANRKSPKGRANLKNTSISPVTRKNARFRGGKIASSTPLKGALKSFLTHSTEKKLQSFYEPVGTKERIDPCVCCMKFNSGIFRGLSCKEAMLPSMPFLGANSIGGGDDNEDAPKTVVEVLDEENEEVKDNEEDITALMIASSTIRSSGKRGLSRAERRKEKLSREFAANLAMLAPEEPMVLQEKAQSYAQAYFDKAKDRLDPCDYDAFAAILNDFNENIGSVSELYGRMEQILGKRHKDILEEFLTFLTPAQARDVGKLRPYYVLNNMSLFLRKLEIYFKEQPAHLRKIYRSLNDLSTCMHVTMGRVKNTILPLLKGNSLLTDWFLQIFPSEPPPESLLKGAWEQVEITTSEDFFESVALPETEDQYGGPHCICSCHETEDLLFKSRSRHCTPCGLKFIQGRVYIQTGKGLRQANVTFNSSPEVDHNARLNCPAADKRKRASPCKVASPVKEPPEDARTAPDSEDDAETARRKSRAVKSPRKKRPKPAPGRPEKPVGKVAETPTKVQETIAQPAETKTPAPMEAEHSAESESEFCEESSQDNINTETDDSADELESLSNSPAPHSDNSNNGFETVSWTREEDKIVLETLQREGNNEDTFVRISQVLQKRSVAQIKERFAALMNLLQAMTSSSISN